MAVRQLLIWQTALLTYASVQCEIEFSSIDDLSIWLSRHSSPSPTPLFNTIRQCMREMDTVLLSNPGTFQDGADGTNRWANEPSVVQDGI